MRRIGELDRETAGILAEEILATLEDRERTSEQNAEIQMEAVSGQRMTEAENAQQERKKEATQEKKIPKSEAEGVILPQSPQEGDGTSAWCFLEEGKTTGNANEEVWRGTEAQTDLPQFQADRRTEDRRVRRDAEALSRFLCRESRRYDTGFTRY